MRFFPRRILPFAFLFISPCLLLLSGCSHHSSSGSEEHSGAETTTAVETEESQSFVLSEKKQQAAGIQTEDVVERSLQAMATVPGRVQYDDSWHIEVKAPTDGVLHEVRMKPGTPVKQGDVLAIVSCPQIGTARADVLQREMEFALARQKLDWKDSACTGLKQLISAVLEGRDPQALSQDLAQLKLGNYRDQVVSAYTRFRLAQSLATAADSAIESGALSGRTIQERLSERDAAKAALTSVTEQLLFQATQDRDMARLELEDSERRLKIARQVVQTLLGEDEKAAPKINEDQLSLVEIRSPISGTIESRNFSRQERVKAADTLFVLANTKQLWISADIREQEWGALALEPGETLRITSPALPGQTLTSKLEYVGREVDPQNNAVPLVASIANPAGLLRPGQFVWVQLPVGKVRNAIAVPESAIVEHNGESFIFVREPENHFRRITVQPGIQDGKYVEVLQGLTNGMAVVTSGAFVLKSEMLLEREE